MEAGYQVSNKKAQICKRRVKYLGFNIMWGRRSSKLKGKQFVPSLPLQLARRSVSSWEQQDSVGYGFLDFQACPGGYIRL